MTPIGNTGLAECPGAMFYGPVRDCNQTHTRHGCTKLEGNDAAGRTGANHPDADRMTCSLTFLKGSIQNHRKFLGSNNGQLRSCSEIAEGTSGHWILNIGSSKRTPRTADGV